MDIVIRVQGSQPEPYTVNFTFANGTIITACNCKAGSIGQMCKHRIDVLSENYAAALEMTDDKKMQISSAFKNTSAYAIWVELSEKELELKRIKSEADTLKKKFAKAIS